MKDRLLLLEVAGCPSAENGEWSLLLLLFMVVPMKEDAAPSRGRVESCEVKGAFG